MKKNKKNNIKLLRICISFAIVIILAILSEYNVFKTENTAISSTELNQGNLISKSQPNIDISSIPEYSGQIVIDINNNIPYFTDEEITTDEFEIYSNLDELRRGGAAFGNICKNIT